MSIFNLSGRPREAELERGEPAAPSAVKLRKEESKEQGVASVADAITPCVAQTQQMVLPPSSAKYADCEAKTPPVVLTSPNTVGCGSEESAHLRRDGDAPKKGPPSLQKLEDDAQAGIEREEAMAADGCGVALPADGLWGQTRALLAYMTCTEVHTYAFSVAANVILALFPFIVLMLTLAQQVFHSPAMVVVVGELMRSLLPTSQDFVMRNMTILAHPRKGTQLFSLVMLLITSTGVFLPLEVALNSVWGVKKNRNYLQNQLVALGLAAGVSALVMASVALTAGQKSVMTLIFFGHTNNFIFYFLANGMMRFCAVISSILLFFLIYWILPNRKIPAMAVLPTAIVVGLAWEVAKYLYVLALPRLDFEAVYGPFRVSVGLMMWAFLSGLLLLAGAHISATRYTLRLAREAED